MDYNTLKIIEGNFFKKHVSHTATEDGKYTASCRYRVMRIDGVFSAWVTVSKRLELKEGETYFLFDLVTDKHKNKTLEFAEPCLVLGWIK